MPNKVVVFYEGLSTKVVRWIATLDYVCINVKYILEESNNANENYFYPCDVTLPVFLQ